MNSSIQKIHTVLGLRVLVQVVKPQSQVGIMLPTSSDKPTTGKVVKIGTGEYKHDKLVEVKNINTGDVVLFNKYGGTEVKINDDEFIIINASDILAVVETEN